MTKGRPQYCVVSVVLCATGSWRIHLEYEDGETFLSKATFATEPEAKTAALKWGNENNVPHGPLQ